MIITRKKTFPINQNSHVTVSIMGQQLKQQQMEIKYFTDSVYSSLMYPVPFTLSDSIQKGQDQNQNTQIQVKVPRRVIQMNFDFLLTQTKTHKKIFDNIGVINIKNNTKTIRYGILVTQQKGTIYVSLIQ